jgi:thioredoxin-like negative regulator of GroEL
MDEISKSSQFTVVKFYTTWCKYCKQLHEVYDKVAEEVKKLNNQEVKVVLSRIECDSNMDIPVMYGIYSYPEVVMFYEGQPISQFKGKRNVNFMMFWIRKSLPYITFDVKKGVNENTIENIKEVSNNDEDEENKGSEEIELTKEEVDTINSQLKSLEKNIFEKEVILEELLLEKREYSYLILYIVLFIIILLSFFILLYIIIKGLRKKEKSI